MRWICIVIEFAVVKCNLLIMLFIVSWQLLLSQTSYNGIDVSHHNGKINWKEVAKDKKIQFVYIKATTGATSTDDCYAYNIKNARENGLKVGSYHFFTSYSSAQKQFDNFKSVAKKTNQDLIPMVDVETSLEKWTKKQIQDSLLVFMRLCKAHYGVYPMVYSGQNVYNEYLAPRFNKFHLMLGKYNGKKPVIQGAGHYTVWQYSETGTIKGISGKVDLSCFHKEYTVKNISMPKKNKKK